MIDNKWFEKGELPPIGVMFNYVTSDSAFKTKILHVHNNLAWLEGIGIVVIKIEKFRPLKTDREIFSESVFEALKNTGIECDTLLVNTLFNAGFRVTESLK